MFCPSVVYLMVCVVYCLPTQTNGQSVGGADNTKSLTTEPLVLNMCGIIETGGTDVVTDFRKVAPAIDLGLTDANNVVLPAGIRLEFYYKDAGPRCSPRNDAFQRIMEYMTENITCNVFLGPGCDDATADVQSVAESTNVPILACPAANIADATGRDRTEFKHLMRSPFFYTEISDTILYFLWSQNYTDIAVIIDPSNSFFYGLGSRIRSLARSITVKRKYLHDMRLYYNFLRSDGTESEGKLEQTLEDINATARVVIVLEPAQYTRNILVAAMTLNMAAGEHVYVALELYQSPVWGHLAAGQHDANDRLAKEGMKSVILFGMDDVRDASSTDFDNEVRRLSRTKFADVYRYAAFENVDPIAVAFYESIILYASAVRTIVERDISVLDTDQLLLAMKNVTYRSPRGENISTDEDGDRITSYVFKEFDLDIEEFQVRVKSTNKKFEWSGKFRYPCHNTNGDYSCPLPPNIPVCGFDGSLCFDDEEISPGILVAIAIGVVASVAAAVGYCYYRRSISEKDPYWWRIQKDDVVFSSKARSSISMRKSRRSFTDSEDGPSEKSTSPPSAALTATYNQNTISLSILPENEFKVSPKLISELKTVHLLRHPNLQKVVGIVIDSQNVCVYKAGEWCSRGSLDDVLENDSIKLDWAFKYSLMKDVAEGVHYLHASIVASHGFLNAMTCLVDSRFVIKISDFGVTQLHNTAVYEPPDDTNLTEDFSIFLWRAPELLRQVMPRKGTQKGDVYSFAILLQQIILRNGPFEADRDPDAEVSEYYILDTKDVVMRVKEGTTPPRRPIVSPSACTTELRTLMIKCWAESPVDRPAFTKIKETIKKIAGSAGENIIDHLIEQMEQYAADLEKRVAEQTQQFMVEKEKTEELLCQLLPRSVAAALTRGETVNPEYYEMVSIYYSDIVGFTTISAQGSAMDVVALLNSLFSLFDSIIENYDAYKVETIGDAYMIASGLPTRNGERHGVEIALTALSIVRGLESFKILHIPEKKLQVRIGLNSGSCVAGVVGMQMPRYCLFGDTVTIAQRLEWSGEPMKIQISADTKDLLQRTGTFTIRERGLTGLKEQGTRMTYWLEG